MNRREAIKIVVDLLDKELVVHANGMICRESYDACDRMENFYMVGSMGLASSIGLGLAINLPHRKIIVFDGDGNLLMNLGSMTMIGELLPKNLLHIVFDNEAYGSTGNQRTISDTIKLEEIARGAGYPIVEKVKEKDKLKKIIKECLKCDGPIFILIKVSIESDEGIARVSHTPESIKRRFISAIDLS
jgi:thiamine pyrophosphate-dependent acetolactate synthase large subunit-like protein